MMSRKLSSHLDTLLINRWVGPVGRRKVDHDMVPKGIEWMGS
jgi:hypothetical protein